VAKAGLIPKNVKRKDLTPGSPSCQKCRSDPYVFVESEQPKTDQVSKEPRGKPVSLSDLLERRSIGP